MRIVSSLLVLLGISMCLEPAFDARAQGVGPLASSKVKGAPALRQDVKLKCKLTNGKLICENKQAGQGQGQGNKCKGPNKCGPGYRDLEVPNKYGACCEPAQAGGNKCKGPNQCGPGYRDLEAPNKYGACCEQVAAPPPKDDGPKSGGCQKAEPNKHTLNCTPPFAARSCGAVQGDGTMTCCCVK